MDGERKKRRILGRKDEEVEDAKVDNFYALIRKSREIHGHEFKIEDPKEEERRPSVMLWQPSFKLEDFGFHDKSVQVAGSSGNDNGGCKQGKNGVNLELSL